MSELWDYLLTGIIILGAIYYLYRTFVVKGGCSCGSSCCGSGDKQAAQKACSTEKPGDGKCVSAGQIFFYSGLVIIAMFILYRYARRIIVPGIFGSGQCLPAKTV